MPTRARRDSFLSPIEVAANPVDRSELATSLALFLEALQRIAARVVVPPPPRGFDRITRSVTRYPYDTPYGETTTFTVDPRGDVTVNAMCPAWVDSAGSGGGGRPVADGADTIVWLATHPAGGPNGRFFRDRREIAW